MRQLCHILMILHKNHLWWLFPSHKLDIDKMIDFDCGFLESHRQSDEVTDTWSHH